jgi:Excreted virulence factor EspC, type VII ESX diderm
MTLRVKPDGLRQLARVLDDTNDAATTAKEYVRRYGEMQWYDEGILATARLSHEPFVRNLTSKLLHLSEVLDRSGIELRAAAGWYERQDLASAVTIDNSYPDVQRSLIAPT